MGKLRLYATLNSGLFFKNFRPKAFALWFCLWFLQYQAKHNLHTSLSTLYGIVELQFDQSLM